MFYFVNIYNILIKSILDILKFKMISYVMTIFLTNGFALSGL